MMHREHLSHDDCDEKTCQVYCAYRNNQIEHESMGNYTLAETYEQCAKEAKAECPAHQ